MTGGNDFSPSESRERGRLTGGRCLLSEGPALSPEWTGRAGRGDERETSVVRRRPSPWNKQNTCFLEESQGSDLTQEPVHPRSTPTAVSGCEQL